MNRRQFLRLKGRSAGALFLTACDRSMIVNGANGFPHPVHIHSNQFQVLSRTGTPSEVAQGYVDERRNDTVLMMPDETATLPMCFSDHGGMFVYHCHNLEHEDGGMMRNYRIVA